MSYMYQPLLPAASRYLQERWAQAAYRQHRSKVDSASPVVDTRGPQPPLHLPGNLKRRQLDRAHQAVRERDNCIHSARLLAIAQSRGRVDNWNSYSARSLSRERHRRERVQITAENQRLAGRLGRQQVACAQEPWERRGERMEITRDGIARYPCGLQAPQTGAKKQRQEALSCRLLSSGPEEHCGSSRHGANTAPLRRARGVAMPHWGAPGEMGPSPPQRSARRAGTIPASGARLGTGASARRPNPAASSSPRGPAMSAGAVAGERAGGSLAAGPRPLKPGVRHQAAAGEPGSSLWLWKCREGAQISQLGRRREAPTSVQGRLGRACERQLLLTPGSAPESLSRETQGRAQPLTRGVAGQFPAQLKCLRGAWCP